MTLLSKFRSSKGIHMFEWIAVFMAIATGVLLMSKLTKGYWNARMQNNDVNITESFYDRFPKGQLSDDGGGGCKPTDWVLINACGVGDCGLCQKIAFNNCNDKACFNPGEPVENCPECSKADICLGVKHSFGCWSDQPTEEQISVFGAKLPCGLGDLIVDKVDCSAGGNGQSTISCIPNTACDFKCQNISEQFIGSWYIPCPSNETNKPKNGNTDATFSAYGSCSDKPCSFQCPQGFEINTNNYTNPLVNYGNIAPSNICECPFDGGNPNPYTVVMVNGKLTCECVQDKPRCVDAGLCKTKNSSDECSFPCKWNSVSGSCAMDNSSTGDICYTSTVGTDCPLAPYCTLSTPPEKKCDTPPVVDPGGPKCCEPDAVAPQCPSCVFRQVEGYIPPNCSCPGPACQWQEYDQATWEQCEPNPNAYTCANKASCDFGCHSIPCPPGAN